jgi:hypothetical protein
MRSVLRMQRRLLSVGLLWLSVGLASAAWAQEDTVPKRTLRSPAVVRGTVGCESHDSYVIQARAGQEITARIAWQRAGEEHAEFSVSESPDLYNSAPAAFGRRSDGGRRWSGRVAKNESYYIYVVAHPEASYVLRVTLK